MKDARQGDGWPDLLEGEPEPGEPREPAPEPTEPTEPGWEELLVRLQDFFRLQPSKADIPRGVAEILEQWSQETSGATIATAMVLTEVLSHPAVLSGQDTDIEKLKPVVNNAWQKNLRELPQEKRSMLEWASDDLIEDIRRQIELDHPGDDVLRELARVSEDWRRRWKKEDLEVLRVIELAAIGAVLQQIHLVTEPGDRLAVPQDTWLEKTLSGLSRPEDSSPAKREESSPGKREESPAKVPTDLRAHLEELSISSKQKTLEMKLKSAGDELLLDLAKSFELRSARAPAHVGGDLAEELWPQISEWQLRHSAGSAGSSASLRTMARLARSVISSGDKDFASLRPRIEEAWRRAEAGMSCEAFGEVLSAGEELVAGLEQLFNDTRRLGEVSSTEISEFTEEWKIRQLAALNTFMESDVGRLIE
ncbi:unnamed protein product, partial [Effrenium voratum]